MPLPDFLCIGAQKSGTTWLDQMLRSHPDIRMPATDKELHFFDKNYDKGIDWYARQFQAFGNYEAKRYRLGEVTPSYLYLDYVPERIYESLGASVKFIVVLRNPVDRMYSQYKTAIVEQDYKHDFATFSKHADHAFRRGLYSEQIQRYCNLFKREKFVFLIYEQLFQNMDEELARLAAHLDVNARDFDTTLKSRRYGAFQERPRFHRAYMAARSLQKYLIKYEFHAPIYLAKRLGVHKGLFGKAAKFPPVPDALRAELMAFYADDIARTEALTGLDLRSWWGDPA